MICLLHTASPTVAGRASDITVGILALQGGIREHAEVVESLGARVRLLRKPEHCVTGADGVDALILPGGESSTMDRLLRLCDMVSPIKALIASGVPVLGTCAGLILLATDIIDRAPGQGSLEVVDISVRRNAFGSQLVSTTERFSLTGCETPHYVNGALIRAPEILRIGDGVRELVSFSGRVLGITTTDDSHDLLGRITGVAFHPEINRDATLHRAILEQALERKFSGNRNSSVE